MPNWKAIWEILPATAPVKKSRSAGPRILTIFPGLTPETPNILLRVFSSTCIPGILMLSLTKESTTGPNGDHPGLLDDWPFRR